MPLRHSYPVCGASKLTDFNRLGQDEVPTLQVRRRLLAENAISSLKYVLSGMLLSMPDKPKYKDTPSSRTYYRHSEMSEWIQTLLKTYDAAASSADSVKMDQAEEQAEKETQDDGSCADPSETQNDEDRGESFFHSVGPTGRFDGMPSGVRYDPSAVYIRIRQKYVDKRTLDFFDLPWTIPKVCYVASIGVLLVLTIKQEDPQYFVVWKSMGLGECERLFEHTKRLRISDDMKKIKSNCAVDCLLGRWMNAKPVVAPETAQSKERAKELVAFEKDLAKLAKNEDRPRRQIYIDEPIEERHKPRINRRIGQTTDYWKSWVPNGILLQSLKTAGWRPVYVRGSETGQTWFYGGQVIHVRRFTEDYNPREQAPKTEDIAKDGREYLIIGKEWLEEEAINRHGYEHRSMESSWALDPRLTWSDIDILVGATSAFREDRLFRKFRALPGGDLPGLPRFAMPSEEYLQGPRVPSPRSAAFNEYHAVPMRAEAPRFEAGLAKHFPHRLDDVVEESEPSVHEAPASALRSPDLESHHSFVEVDE